MAKSVSNYVELDYSNTDRLCELVEKLGVRYLVPGCNDRSYMACAEVSERFPFPGIDTKRATETINSKDHFRRFAQEVGIPIPQVLGADGGGDVWPVIVKPVDAYSGRGVTIVSRADRHLLADAIKVAQQFSRSGRFIVEEYVEGQLFSHSAFVRAGQVVTDFIVEEHCKANSFVVDTSRVVFAFPESLAERLREIVVLMVKELDLVDGLVHTQFVLRGEDVWVIEVTRRCPGDLYSQLIELTTNFPYAASYAAPFLGSAPSLGATPDRLQHILRHTVSLPVDRVFNSLKFHVSVKLEKLVPIATTGDLVRASPFGRIALLFARANSEQELLHLFQKTVDRALYSVE
jgi:predicted ATP-grasp superfamily ATP-dependent carboligase